MLVDLVVVGVDYQVVEVEIEYLQVLQWMLGQQWQLVLVM